MKDVTDNDIPAFPCKYTDFATFGMTLRDYFAAKAMQGWVANPVENNATLSAAAKWSYKVADEMLKARDAR